MKKLFKALLVVACAGTLCAGAVALSACGGGEKDTAAYGLVHGAGYIGYADVKVDAEDRVTYAYFTEICFPTQVPQTPKTETTAATYYSEVTYGNVTMTYDAEAKTYKVGDLILKEYFKEEANCKTYVDAVKEGKVAVTVDGAKKYDVMTWSKLCKDANGYWGTANSSQKLNWKGNRDAMVKYVMDNGVSKLLTLVKATEGDNKGYWVDSSSVSTGATWTDMNTDKEGSISYAQLMVNAFNKVAKTPVTK